MTALFDVSAGQLGHLITEHLRDILHDGAVLSGGCCGQVRVDWSATIDADLGRFPVRLPASECMLCGQIGIIDIAICN